MLLLSGSSCTFELATLHRDGMTVGRLIIPCPSVPRPTTSPLFDFMPYFGNRTLTQQKTTELVVRHLFSNASFMSLLMKDAFEIASYDKIIPQFGADSSAYYSVLQYLFRGGDAAESAVGAGARAVPGAAERGVALPGVPQRIAEYLGGLASGAGDALRSLG